MDNLLPIGSIVLLDGADKRLMICGVAQTNPADGKVYDYLACLYPEGFIGAKHTYLFDHKEIQRIDAEGFTDDEYATFRANLNEFINGQIVEAGEG